MAGEEITWDEMIFSNAKLDPMLNLSQFDKSLLPYFFRVNAFKFLLLSGIISI